MWTKIIPWIMGTLLLMEIHPGKCQEDSLKSALNAVNRLQRDLSNNHGPDEYYYTDDYPSAADRKSLEREVFDQLQGDEDFDINDMNKWGANKRISSSFRERILEENSNEENKKYLADLLLNQLRDRESLGDTEETDDYPKFLKQILNSYDINYPKVYSNSGYEKRYIPFGYYPNLGYNNIGMKKRYHGNNFMYAPNYELRDDYYENLENPLQYFDNQRANKERDNLDFSNYPMRKRFRVSKRSSPEKKYAKNNIRKTDPKVEEDLSNIFEKSKKPGSVNYPKKPLKTDSSINTSKQLSLTNNKYHSNEKSNLKNKTDSVKIKNKNQKLKSLNKETTAFVSNQFPLHIEKKSINLSDYFGIDKRKSGELDNEWLLERYHKAVAMAAKRNSHQASRKIFPKEIEPDFLLNDKNRILSDLNIDKVDTELENVEDSLIDDTLKYTGAHHGDEIDSRVIEELKDKVISQLAAAYNLEKMRQVLGEYKNNMKNHKNDDLDIKNPAQEQSEDIDEFIGKENTKCEDSEDDCQEREFKNSVRTFDKE